MSLFEGLLDCLQCGCIIFHSYQQHMRVPTSPHPHQHLISAFLVITILLGVKWFLLEVFICISLMTNDTEHLFTHCVLLN